LKPTSENFCSDSLMRKRGNMLPPSAFSPSTIRFASPESCWRVRESVASTSPNAAAAAAVNTVMITKPGRWERSGSLNTSMPHTNITAICAHANVVKASHLASRSPFMPSPVVSTRSSVPDSVSSISAPPAPAAENMMNMTAMPAA
jgi:hypothetical protein